MNDDTLIAQVREVGAHYLRLVEEAEKRGFEIRIERRYSRLGDGGPKDTIEILKRIT